MKRITTTLAILAASAATLIPATTAQAVVDRICVRSNGAATGSILAYYGSSSVWVTRGQCTSSSTEPSKWYVGPTACTSDWGHIYPHQSGPYSMTLINGTLYLTCY